MRVIKAAPRSLPLGTEFERLFDQFVTGLPVLEGDRDTPLTWTPRLDFSEMEKEYVVRLEAPGMAKEDLDVSLDGQMLTISGRRELSREDKGEEYFWREREEGRFIRTIRLPSPVKADAVDARYSDGVITIRLTKVSPATHSRIAIK